MSDDLRSKIEVRLAVDKHGWNHYDDHPHDAEHDLRALLAATDDREVAARAWDEGCDAALRAGERDALINPYREKGEDR